MAKKRSTGKTGSGNQDDKAPGGKRGEGGDDTDTDEEEEEEEDDVEEDDDSEAKAKSKGGAGDDKSKDKKADAEPDLATLPQETQDYIKKLRRESAKYRTKASNLETSYSTLTARMKSLAGGKEGDGDDDDATPEQRVESLGQAASTLQFDNAILQSALEHGVSKDGLKYFRFLVSEKVAELGEGEELSDEDLAELAADAAEKVGSKGKTKTSVTAGDGKGGGKGPSGKGEVTLDQFAAMSIGQKSELQKRNPDLYKTLFTEALKTRRFI